MEILVEIAGSRLETVMCTVEDQHAKLTFLVIEDKKGYRILMIKLASQYVIYSRYLMNAPRNMVVDHKDGNSLNNSIINLRLATRSQNAANTGLSVRNTSGYKGITLMSGKYYASITVNYRKVQLGSSHDPVEAAMLYDVAATKYFGEFAKLNFPIS